MIKKEIAFILGEDNQQYIEEWLHLDNTIYYNNENTPTGIIACINGNGITYIAVTTRQHDDKTFAKMPMKMRKDMYKLLKLDNIAIPFLKHSSGSKEIITILNKINGILSEYDNTHYIWYSKE